MAGKRKLRAIPGALDQPRECWGPKLGPGESPHSEGEMDLDKACLGYSLWCGGRCKERAPAWLGLSWKASQRW